MTTLARVIEMDEEAGHAGRIMFLRGFFQLFSHLRELKTLVIKELNILLAPTLLSVSILVRREIMGDDHDASGRSSDGIHLFRRQRLVMPDGKT